MKAPNRETFQGVCPLKYSYKTSRISVNVRDRALRHSISSAIIYTGPKQSHGIHISHKEYNTEGSVNNDIGKRSEQMAKLEQKFINRKVVKLTLDTQKYKATKKCWKVQFMRNLKKPQTTVENKQLLTEYDCNIHNSSGDIRVSHWVITDNSLTYIVSYI
jgi:hypothetical protein